MTSEAASTDGLARLRFLVEVTALEAQHLARTDARLFSEPMTPARAAGLANDVDASEQVDAFVVRFGRLQDTVADKLLPALLDQVAEPLGSVIDNLARAEKLGWVESVDRWLAARKLRNRMIHEYVRDAEVLAAALSAGHAAVPLLLAATAALGAEAKRRFGI